MRELIPGLWDMDTLPGAQAYIWEWDRGVTIIDTGLPGHVDRLLDAVTALGYRSDQVTRIVITHGDADHMGNARALARHTQAPVGCHAVEKEILEHPERRPWPSRGLGRALRPLFTLAARMPGLRALPVHPQELYVDGQRLPEGFRVVHTPGHTPGHIALVHPERKVLIAGDALNNRGGELHLPPRIATPDPENARRSVERLMRRYGKEIQVAVFGHGPPILEDAGPRIAAFLDRLGPG